MKRLDLSVISLSHKLVTKHGYSRQTVDRAVFRRFIFMRYLLALLVSRQWAFLLPYLDFHCETKPIMIDLRQALSKEKDQTLVGPHGSPARVNVSNGNLLVERTDVNMPAPGIDLNITRFYNGLDIIDKINAPLYVDTDIFFPGEAAFESNPNPLPQPFGKKWSFTYNMYIYPVDRNYPMKNVILPDTFVFLHEGDGREYEFIKPPYTMVDPPGDTMIFISPSNHKEWNLEKLAGPDHFKYRLTKDKKLFYDFADPDGDSIAQLMKISDRNGNAIMLTYNGKLLEKIETSSGKYVEITHKIIAGNPSPLIETIKDFAGRVWTYTYLPSNTIDANLKTAVEPDGRTTIYQYQPDDLLASAKIGQTTLYALAYDIYNRVTSIVTPGDQASCIYSPGVHPVSASMTEVTAGGKKATYFYSPWNRWTNENRLNPGGGEVNVIMDALYQPSIFVYDAAGNLTLYQNRRSVTRTFQYDGQNHITGMTNADGVTTFTRDDLGNITSITTPEGRVTSFSYDGRGNMKSRIGVGVSFSFEHYSDGQIKTMKDGNNKITSLFYDSFGYLNKIIDARGNQTTYHYNTLLQQALGVPGLIKNSKGATAFGYDKRGRVREKTNLAVNLGNQSKNLKTIYDYNDLDQITSISSPNSLTEFSHNAQERVQSIKRSGGGTLQSTFQYDAAGNISKSTNEKGLTEDFIYDDLNRVQTITRNVKGAPGNNVENFEYDQEGNITTHWLWTDVTEWTYDPMDRVKNIFQNAIDVGMGVEVNPSRNITYDGDGNRVTSQGLDGTQTTFEYDANTGRLKKITNPLFVNEFQYDDAGNLIKLIEGNGARTTTFTYDAVNNIASTNISGVNATTRFDYDGGGNLIQTINPIGLVTHFDVNALGQVLKSTASGGAAGTKVNKTFYNVGGDIIGTVDPLGHQSTFTVNRLGQIKQESRNEVGTTFGHDPFNNVNSITDALGQSTKFSHNQRGDMLTRSRGGQTTSNTYDLFGNVIQENQNGKIVNHKFNHLGMVLSVTNPAGQQTEYLRHITGALKKVKTPTGQVLNFDADALGRVTKSTDEFGNSTLFGYDLLGNMNTITLPNGDIINMTHDESGNVLTRTGPGVNESYTYDKNGNLLTETNANGTITREVDLFGRLTKITYPDGKTIEYVWNLNDEKTQMVVTAPSDPPKVWNYTVASPLEKIQDPDGGITTFSYDALDREVERILPNGQRITRTYDIHDNITNERATSPSGALISNTVMEYDTWNMLTEITVNGVKNTYKYTPSGELKEYTDNAGNKTSITYDNGMGNKISEMTYNKDGVLIERRSYLYTESATPGVPGNRVDMMEVFIPGVDYVLYSYAYNKSGDITTRHELRLSPWGDFLITIYDFEYDAEKMLTAVTVTGNTGTVTNYQFRYTADGTLLSQTTPDGTTEFLVDPITQNVILKKTGSDLTTYTTTNAIDDMVSENVNGEVRYHYSSNRYKPMEILSDAKGRILEIRWFDPMGRMTVGGGTGTFKQAYFQGRPIYQDLKLVYSRARWRDQPSGNFLTHDPIPFDQFAGARSQYEFAMSNAVNHGDPTGLFALKIHEEITREALGGFLNQIPANIIVIANLDQDLHQLSSEFHFDNNKIAQGVGYIAGQYNLIKNLSKKPKSDKNTRKILEAFGRILHAIQDFYSHSNWVELNAEAKNFPFPIWGFNNIPDLDKVGLRTGSFPPVKKPTHAQLNKDDENEPSSKKRFFGKTAHEWAKELATKHTLHEYQKLKRLVPDIEKRTIKIQK